MLSHVVQYELELSESAALEIGGHVVHDVGDFLNTVAFGARQPGERGVDFASDATGLYAERVADVVVDPSGDFVLLP